MKSLLNALKAEFEPLAQAYNQIALNSAYYKEGYWKTTRDYEDIENTFARKIDIYETWVALIEHAYHHEKKGVKVWYYFGDIEELDTPIEIFKEYLQALDKVHTLGYTPATKKINNVSQTVRLGELVGEQSLIILADRLQIFLEQSNQDPLFAEQANLAKKLFEQAKNAPAPDDSRVKKFSANAVMSLSADGLDEFLQVFIGKCIDMPIYGKQPIAPPPKKEHYLISLSNDNYEFHHRFASIDVPMALDFTGAEFWYLNKKDKNINFYVDVIRDLGIIPPVYDTPFSLGIAIWPLDTTRKRIYITGFETCYDVPNRTLADLHKTDLYNLTKSHQDKSDFMKLCELYDDYVHKGVYPLSISNKIILKNSVGRKIWPKDS